MTNYKRKGISLAEEMRYWSKENRRPKRHHPPTSNDTPLVKVGRISHGVRQNSFRYALNKGSPKENRLSKASLFPRDKAVP